MMGDFPSGVFLLFVAMKGMYRHNAKNQMKKASHDTHGNYNGSN